LASRGKKRSGALESNQGDICYTGSARSVYPYLETLKQAEVKPSANPQRILKYTPNAAVWLFVRDPKDLEKVEQEALAALCRASAQLRSAYGLVQDFFSMVHKRQGYRLDAWLERVASSDLPELQSFANGVERDKAAVQAGLTWWINNGVVQPLNMVDKSASLFQTHFWPVFGPEAVKTGHLFLK
jgi:transposase